MAFKTQIWNLAKSYISNGRLLDWRDFSPVSRLVSCPLLHFLTHRIAMPSISSQSWLTKHFKHYKLLSAITAATIISIYSIILPSLYNNPPQPMRTSQLSGKEYMDEVLNCNNTRRCQEVFRMKPKVFQFLCSELQSKGGLYASRHIAVDKKVTMFL